MPKIIKISQCFTKLYSLAAPPRSATLPWWWGLAPMTRKISKIWRRGATKHWSNSCRQIATCLSVLLCWFRLYSRLRLYSGLLTALQPSIYDFTAVTTLWPLPVTFWLHSETRIGPSWYGLSAGQV